MGEHATWRHQGSNEEQSELQTEIAIVDDDPMVRGSLARLLKALSFFFSLVTPLMIFVSLFSSEQPMYISATLCD